MGADTSFYVVVFKDEVVLIEAYTMDEALDIVNQEFKEFDPEREKFTMLPVTSYFLEEKDEEKPESIDFTGV